MPSRTPLSIRGTGGSAPATLPTPASELVGREAEVRAVVALLRGARLVTLTGSPGVGKTRLALEAARRLHHGSQRQVCWVDLAPVSKPAHLWNAIGSALGFPCRSSASRHGHLLTRLDQGPLLLVLDTCEHLVGACGELAGQLLAESPGLSVLATSRQRLAVAGEHTSQVLPLPLPAGSARPDLDASEAAQLFLMRARAVRSGMAMGSDACKAVAEICMRLDGVPLAIELAAAQLEALSILDVAKRLDDPLRLLVAPSDAVVPRHRSLRESIDWSYDTLSDPERALLRRLSIFRGGCTLDGAERVCAFGGLQREDVLDLLRKLVAKGLVQADTTCAEARYSLHEAMRHYAGELLTGAGEAERTRMAHASWCTALVTRTPENKSTPAQIRDEHDNICGLLEWAVGQARVGLAVRLAWGLLPFWRSTRRIDEGRRWFESALVPLTTAEPSDLRARVLYGAALFSLLDGDVTVALRLVKECVDRAREGGHPMTTAWSLNLLGLVCLSADPADSVPVIEESLALARRSGTGPTLPGLLASLGTAYCARGDLANARKVFEECLEVSGTDGDDAAGARLGLGRVAFADGDLAAAEDHLNQALAEARRRGDHHTAARTLGLLGDVARARGQGELARCRLHEALALARGLDLPYLLPTFLVGLGWLALAEAEPSEARRHFDEAASTAERLKMRHVVAYCLEGLSEVAQALGENRAARARAETAVAVARDCGDTRSVARALHRLGRLSQYDDDHARARSLHQEALRLRSESGDRLGVIESLDTCASLATDGGRSAAAARLFAVAQALADKLGASIFRLPGEHAHREAQLATLRLRLGDDGFRQAWEQGASMTLDEATSYAQRGWGPRERLTSGWGSLTRAEQEVAAFASKGLTNREIGVRLFISPRTVQRHLSAVFAKLDVSSRRELLGLAPHDEPY